MSNRITYLKPFGVMINPDKKNQSLKTLDIKRLRKLFSENKLIVIRGFDTFCDADDLAAYCEQWGEISLWPFGKVLELVEHDNPDDHIFDHNYVPLHWDGMYRSHIPEYQIFHCVNAPLPGQGGRTTFSNTVSVLENASDELEDFWKKVTGFYQRKMAFYDSKTVSSIITRHPYKDFNVIRYNEPPSEENKNFINPPDLKFDGVEKSLLPKFHKTLKKALYNPLHFYAHEWQTNDVVIADNFSLLHGREAFVSKSPRHIRRVHVLSNPPFNNPGLVYKK